MLDLLDKSNKLKSKYNELLLEHTAFINKHDTVNKYKKQIKKYIEKQRMKRERERSKQRTQAKQKKNYLE